MCLKSLITPLLLAAGLFSSESFGIDRDNSPEAAARGRLVVEKGSYLTAAWKIDTWDKLKSTTKPLPESLQTTPETKKTDAATIAQLRYGLHPAPFDNDNLPMGLRRALEKDGKTQGLQIDCLICHGGSIGGKSYVGLGNSTLDFVTFLNAMTRTEGKRPPILTFNLNSTRGTVNAGQLAIVLFSLRNPDLTMRNFPMPLDANLPEQDVPPWWHLARKSTIYIDARTPGESARSLMQFYLGELSEAQFAALEPKFKDLMSYLSTIKPPKWPFEIDQAKAAAGRSIFEKNCSECHGTYGDKPYYPDRLVELDEIGTDPARARGVSEKSIDHYNSTWFGRVHPVDKTVPTGYQAPPLDGVWATAPYLHNGSVPTLDDLLNSKSRPNRFIRHTSTEFENYDREKVGWRVKRIEAGEKPIFSDLFQNRSIFDSSRYGLGNGGHTFGDKLSDRDRSAVIEYLKTL
jgi:mono/diheme cytochrome c family protein